MDREEFKNIVTKICLDNTLDQDISRIVNSLIAMQAKLNDYAELYFKPGIQVELQITQSNQGEEK